MKPAFELPDDWFVENDGQRLVLDPEKVKAAFEARVALQGWQPIDSAPKDGRYIITGRFRDDELKWVKHSRWMSAEEAFEEEGGASADDYDAGWTDGEDEHDYCYPTHWQPLPPASRSI